MKKVKNKEPEAPSSVLRWKLLREIGRGGFGGV
jgi:hypothetical protein